MIKRYRISERRLEPAGQEEAPVLVVISPSEDEKRWLLDKFSLDEHNLSSAFDPEEPTRLEFEEDHLELIFKRPKNYSSRDHFLFKVSSMGLFLFKSRLIIALSEDVPLFSGKYFRQISGVREIFLKLLYNSIFHFMEHLKIINMIADELENKVNSSMENKHLLNLFTLEKSLVYYLNAINSNTYVIDRLKNNAEKAGLSAQGQEFLDDITIENNQCMRQAEIYSNILAGLMDARASIVSNNLNVMMKNLNAVVIAVAVPSFFAGMGGMSELADVMGLTSQRAAFAVFLAAMLLLAGATYLLIKRFERH